MGRGNYGYLIAQIAVETGIPPQALLELDAFMFANVVKVLTDRAKEGQSGNRVRRRGTA